MKVLLGPSSGDWNLWRRNWGSNQIRLVLKYIHLKATINQTKRKDQFHMNNTYWIFTYNRTASQKTTT